jgi:hypothetical protein
MEVPRDRGTQKSATSVVLAVGANEVDRSLPIRAVEGPLAALDGGEVHVQDVADRFHLETQDPAIVHPGETEVAARGRADGPVGASEQNDAYPEGSGRLLQLPPELGAELALNHGIAAPLAGLLDQEPGADP